jgi:hypothetical protein
MAWFKGNINDIRDTWANDFFAIFIREEARRKTEMEKIEKEKSKNRQGHQGSHGNTEYVLEDKYLENSEEMEDFFNEGEEYTGE